MGAGVDSVGTTAPEGGKQSSAWQQLMPSEQSRGASGSRQEEAPRLGNFCFEFCRTGTATISLGLNI